MIDLRITVSPSLNDTLRARARSLRRPYGHLVREALGVYLDITTPIPPPPPALSSVSGDIARLLQVTVFAANLVRAFSRQLDERDMSQPPGALALLALANLRGDLKSVEAALCASRRQLALHLGELPVAKRIPRTCNRGDTVKRPSKEIP